MGLFKTKKENFNEKQEKLQVQINEVAGKIQQVVNALVNAEVELLVDPSKANSSRVDKLKAGQERFEAEKATLEAELQEVANELAQIEAKEKQSEIKEAAKVFEERSEGYYKLTLFNQKLEKFQNMIYNKTGRLPEANELKAVAGIKYNEDFNEFAHKHLIEARESASESAKLKAEKELEELYKHIEKVLGIKLN